MMGVLTGGHLTFDVASFVQARHVYDNVIISWLLQRIDVYWGNLGSMLANPRNGYPKTIVTSLVLRTKNERTFAVKLSLL